MKTSTLITNLRDALDLATVPDLTVNARHKILHEIAGEMSAILRDPESTQEQREWAYAQETDLRFWATCLLNLWERDVVLVEIRKRVVRWEVRIHYYEVQGL